MNWIVCDYVIYYRRWFRSYSSGFGDYWYSAVTYNQINIVMSSIGAIKLLNIDIKVTENVVSFFFSLTSRLSNQKIYQENYLQLNDRDVGILFQQ